MKEGRKTTACCLSEEEREKKKQTNIQQQLKTNFRFDLQKIDFSVERETRRKTVKVERIYKFSENKSNSNIEISPLKGFYSLNDIFERERFRRDFYDCF